MSNISKKAEDRDFPIIVCSYSRYMKWWWVNYIWYMCVDSTKWTNGMNRLNMVAEDLSEVDQLHLRTHLKILCHLHSDM